MLDTLTIPKTLKVGFQNRNDTYTGKLAYVTFVDSAGKLRKQNSWEGWCDKKIEKVELANVPRSGFVLNREAGGKRHSYSSWNVRIEKVRVFDPEGFEFEIDIPNLLFILQECSSIKGKGLEGEFVYSWNGTQLVLLPVDSQEYAASVSYGKLQEEKISKDEMVVGCSYLTKKKQSVIYMGVYQWWGVPSTYGNSKAGARKHVFALLDKPPYFKETGYGHPDLYILDTGYTKIAKRTSISPAQQYPDIHDALAKSCLVSKPAKLLLTPATHRDSYYAWHNAAVDVAGTIVTGNLRQERTRSFGTFDGNNLTGRYTFEGTQAVSIKNGKIKSSGYTYAKTIPTKELMSTCHSLTVECENGAQHTMLRATFS